MRKPIIVGNWKMHTTIAEARALAAELAVLLRNVYEVEVGLCPPFVSLSAVRSAIGDTPLKLGAQNMHDQDQGAFTGEVSPRMLAGLVDYVIIGHSERRLLFGERDDFINRKVRSALRHGIRPILCVGETLEQNERGETEAVLLRQLEHGLEGISAEEAHQVTIAYEPVWAIGTGRAATPQDAQARCAFVRQRLRAQFGAVADAMRIQYGGSVNATNAGDILKQPDVDGALVGGASLKAAEFVRIVQAAM